MKEETRQSVNSVIKWVILFLAFHLLFAVFLYDFAMTRHVGELIKNSYEDIAVKKVILYDVILLFLFCLYDGLSRMREVSFSMDMKNAMKEQSFSLVRYFWKKQAKFNLAYTIIFAAFQIPYMIFFAIFRGYTEPLLNMMAFYRMEAGFYLACNSSLLGLLLATAVFALILFSTQLFWFFFAHRRILKNAPRGIYERKE